MIRQLPTGTALVIRGDCAPVIARLPRAWNNPAYRRSRRRQASPVCSRPDALSWTGPEPPSPGQGPAHLSDSGHDPRSWPGPGLGRWPGSGPDDTAGTGAEPLPPGWPRAVSPGDPLFPWSRR